MSTENTEKTKHCPSCDKEISFKAKKCPYCQQDLRGWFKRHPILTVLLILITSPFWIAILVGFSQGLSGTSSRSASASPTPPTQTTFVASANFTGTQFVISNLDPHTCENAKMQVNGDYSLDGYTLESGLNSATKSGEVTVYKVGAGQFTKGDGTRFNPYATKPQKFFIECRGDNELKGAYWYGEFQ